VANDQSVSSGAESGRSAWEAPVVRALSIRD
jgi:hypothetical protein